MDALPNELVVYTILLKCDYETCVELAMTCKKMYWLLWQDNVTRGRIRAKKFTLYECLVDGWWWASLYAEPYHWVNEEHFMCLAGASRPLSQIVRSVAKRLAREYNVYEFLLDDCIEGYFDLLCKLVEHNQDELLEILFTSKEIQRLNKLNITHTLWNWELVEVRSPRVLELVTSHTPFRVSTPFSRFICDEIIEAIFHDI